MLKKLIVICGMVIALASQSHAISIGGNVVFNGGLATTDTNDLLTATEITLSGSTSVAAGDGSFGGLVGSAVTFSNGGVLDIASFSGPALFASFANYTFTMASLTSTASTLPNGFDALYITGFGFFDDITGTDQQSAGTFNITLQEPGSGNPVQFSFSSSASAVPEPASLALLGLGLAGLGFARRRA